MWMLVISLIISCSSVASLKCYQCSSQTALGCFSYNLNKAHLKDCPNADNNPVCRSISQVQYFTPGQDVVIMRECAYVYEEPLQCQQSKFSGLHYSLACECRDDGCNKSSNGQGTSSLLAMGLLAWGSIKIFIV